MKKQIIQVPIKRIKGNKVTKGTALLVIPDLDGMKFDSDRLLRINHEMLAAEVVTFPVIANRLGIILAEAESSVNEAVVNYAIGKAKLRKQIRNRLAAEKEKITGDIVDDEMRSSAQYLALNKSLNEKKRRRDIANSIFWEAKDKSTKLDKYVEKTHPEELIIDNIDAEEINGIKIIVKDDFE